MLTYSVVLLHDNGHLHTSACTRALLEHFNWELFDHVSYSPYLAPSNYHLFASWRTEWGHSTSAIMRSWWKVLKRGWTHRHQTSLTQTYKNIFPNMTSTSILAVTMLSSSLSLYVFFVHNNFFLSHCLFCQQLTRGYFPNSPCTMLHNPKLTNSMEQRPSWEGNSNSFSYGIPAVLQYLPSITSYMTFS
jgi:hypothetical protein